MLMVIGTSNQLSKFALFFFFKAKMNIFVHFFILLSLIVPIIYNKFFQ
jgi:hypothetical protein